MSEAVLLEKYKLETLSGANLAGCYLFGVDLSGVNLSGVNLSGANLSKSNLSGASLYGANLSKSNLFGANLSKVSLSGANLSGANLSGAEISGVDLREVNLLGVKGLASMREEMKMLILLREVHPKIFLFKGSPITITSAEVAGSHTIPSMARLFYSSSEEEFLEYLDKLIFGDEPLLQR